MDLHRARGNAVSEPCIHCCDVMLCLRMRYDLSVLCPGLAHRLLNVESCGCAAMSKSKEGELHR